MRRQLAYWPESSLGTPPRGYSGQSAIKTTLFPPSLLSEIRRVRAQLRWTLGPSGSRAQITDRILSSGIEGTVLRESGEDGLYVLKGNLEVEFGFEPEAPFGRAEGFDGFTHVGVDVLR